MASFSERVRKTTTFVLAIFLWSHALFLFDLQSAIASKWTRLIPLTTPEASLITLIILLSLLSGPSSLGMLRSIAFVYFFPFVLLWRAFRASFPVWRAINRWLDWERNSPAKQVQIVATCAAGAPAPAEMAASASSQSTQVAEKLAVVTRAFAQPFRKHTFWWGMLLLFASHRIIILVSLFVIGWHVMRKFFWALRVSLKAKHWLQDACLRTATRCRAVFASVATVSVESAPTPDLRNTWNQIYGWETLAGFLRFRRDLISRWTWLLVIGGLVCFYIYFALLFSFAYCGIARLAGSAYPWPSAAVASLFIPFAIGDLPRILAVKALGYVQCAVIVAAGLGTILNYLRRISEPLQVIAVAINDRLEDQSFRQRYEILREKFGTIPESESRKPRQTSGQTLR